jgi:Tfp pilus assembly protein PilZ
MNPDADPDPAILSLTFKAKSFSAYYFLMAHLHLFLKIKSPKEVTKQ